MNDDVRRRRSPAKVAVVALLSAVTLAACGSDSTSAPEGSTGVVPGPLQTIEAQAEDIIDVAPAGNWDTIATDVDAIGTAWDAYLASPDGDAAPADPKGALTAALEGLRKASAAQDATATMQASNDVSAAIVDLFETYHPAVPAAIGRLDVLGRQISLDVTEDDLAAAGRDVATYAVVWAGVRNLVTEHDGSAEAGDMDASVQRLKDAIAAGDTQALLAEVAVNLELVDDLERVFT